MGVFFMFEGGWGSRNAPNTRSMSYGHAFHVWRLGWGQECVEQATLVRGEVPRRRTCLKGRVLMFDTKDGSGRR